MNRILFVKKTHCQKELLTIQDPRYREWVFQYTFQEFKKDLGKGDITTNTFFVQDREIKAAVIAKESGIFAGRQEIEFFLKKFKNISLRFLKKDAENVEKNEVLLELKGSIFELMKLERVILNLLGRMSGVATFTKKIIGEVKTINPNILITPTRKTLWGWLDKRACVLGGGGTHRLSLDNAILIKHNHLRASGVSLEHFLRKILQSKPIHKGKFVEIEVHNVNNALTAARFFSQTQKRGFRLPCFVMFDNMKSHQIANTLQQIKKARYGDRIFFEVSGRISEKNIRAYARTGVDIISIGAITNSAPMFDLSMRVYPPIKCKCT